MASRPHRIRRYAATLLAVVIILTGCGNGTNSTAGGVDVVATTTILGDLAEDLVGGDGRVTVLLPIGADPHDYQASAQQAASIQTADLVIANGLDLEEGLRDVLEAAAADGANVLSIAQYLDPLPFPGAQAGADGGLDPHVWLDPIRMAQAARLVAGELTKIDESVDWQARGTALADELLAAHAEIEVLLEPIPTQRRKLVSNHNALGYLAARYGFEVIGVVVPGGSTLADPSSAELAALAAVIMEHDVPAIFAETTEPSALADAVAAEAGRDVEVVDLYTGSLGEPGSGADTLIGMLLTDANRIADALS